jgi:hypothetical protein
LNSEGKDNNGSNHSELFSQNQKLKKQINDLKKQLHDLSLSMEKTKIDSAKEVTKWQQKIGSSSSSKSLYSSPAAAITLSPLSAISLEERSNLNKSDAQLIVALKKRLILLERELKIERLSKGIPSNSRTPGNSKNRPPSSSSSSSSVASSVRTGTPPPRPTSNRRASSVSASTRETIQRTKSASPSGFERSNSNRSQRFLGDNARPPLPSNVSRDRRYSSPKTRSLDEIDNHSSSSHRSVGNSSSSSVRNSTKIVNPSSSMGKRFDPTAYHQTKQKKFFDTSSNRQSLSPLSQTSNRRFDSPLESGYSSSNSHVMLLFYLLI